MQNLFLTIKVLRLVRPCLVGPLSLACDARDLTGDLWMKELKTDVTTVPGLENLSLGQFLRLPQGFGNIYLGETFSSYVCIQNESPVPVTNAVVKIELQTSTQKFILADNRSLPLMKTGDTIDIVMHHEVKEMGKHMLICTITYTIPNSSPVPVEPITIERFFKFQVKKPLDVKTKLYNSESDEVFLEAQVQNITASSICLEKVDLEPSMSFTCVSMNKLSDSELITRKRLGIAVLNIPKLDIPNVMLDTECSYQFLYRLTPRSEQARLSTNIGKLDIVWRSSMGERGRLQTSQLQRQPPVLNDLRLVVDNVPDASIVDSPFEALCKLSNLTPDREMDLQLELDPTTDGYCWLGVTKSKIGSLMPNQKFSLRLTVFPIRTGIINISGIKITDLKKGEKFTFNDVVQVYVMQNAN
ncbi:Trafficking protein particle complex subunit 13 [Orchesella cincta]|uniref:Trafficking protein particle complex subunit 13 n=1 Tax=Orchesella cincta TaxID=48709 RepID=A0A1D2MKJ4_ORCCI|nr:Trafficking protein particle complex subunit 13 [Orchesella cincta]